jgi:hypothetical protein
MRWLSNEYDVVIKASKELVNSIKRDTNDDDDGIFFQLLTALDSRIQDKDITAFSHKVAFGLHRVIKYPNSEIKCKCKIVFIRHGFAYVGSTPSPTLVQIEIVPQTGRWIRANNQDIKNFLRSMEQKLVEEDLLGETSSAVPSLTRRL